MACKAACAIAWTCSFFFGTLMIETLLRLMGRFDISSQKPSFIPHIRVGWRFYRYKVTTPRLGHSPTQARATLLVVASLIHAVFFVIMGTGPKYPSMLVAFGLAAFARAFLTAPWLLGHVVTQSISDVWIKVNSIDLAIGAFFSPLVCQSLISNGVSWKSFYLGSLVLSSLNASFLTFAYHPTCSEHNNDRIQASRVVSSMILPHADPNFYIRVGTSFTLATPTALCQALCSPLVWAFAVFLGLYSGSETTTQGFVSYYACCMAANPGTVGYVASGFWAGMAISRIGFGFLYPRQVLSKTSFTFQSVVVALVMHVLVWWMPSLVADAFCTGVIGLVYGPMFPLGVALPTRLLPVDIHMSSMAIMSTVASVGNATFPFIAGLLSNEISLKTYSYMLVAQGVVLVMLWGCLPSKGRD
ncbi:major facilitator superfamily domain-containing protein [Gautieria morchelliformis]|nr:major facilitator superfamily domain-containing protein [Gautieria morchelliformis]